MRVTSFAGILLQFYSFKLLCRKIKNFQPYGQKKVFFHFWLHVNYTIGMFCSEMYLFLWGARYVNCINEMAKSCLINIIHLWFNFGSNDEFRVKESRAAGLKMVKENFHDNIAMLYIKIKYFLYWKSWWQFWGNWKKL